MTAIHDLAWIVALSLLGGVTLASVIAPVAVIDRIQIACGSTGGLTVTLALVRMIGGTGHD